MNENSHAVFRASVLIAAVAGGSALQSEDEMPSQEELLEQARPGPQHERLAQLVGEWQVTRRRVQGTEEARGVGHASTILDGRFLVVDFSLGGEGATESFRYTLGFDRRHDEYSIAVMDTSGTYVVTGRGPELDGVIHMAGVDDDPLMARMGFEKKFVFGLDLAAENAFSLPTIFVDTRTAEERLVPYAEYSFRRKPG